MSPQLSSWHRSRRVRHLLRPHACTRRAAASLRRATVCYMKSVTHREMRNNSGDILRAVAAGESVQVTNHGVLAAVISPPAGMS